MKVVLSRQEILAALIFASNDDSRFVLNGACIEVGPKSTPIIVATDGRRLSVIESAAEQSEPFSDKHSFILRSDFLKAVCALSKAVGGKTFPWIEFEIKPGSKRCTVSFIGGHCFLEAEENALIEGNFPNWRPIVPVINGDRVGVSDLGLNAELVGDYAKVAKLFDLDSPLIQMRMVAKDKAIDVRISNLPSFYGVIMPCKGECDEKQPEFLGLTEEQPA